MAKESEIGTRLSRQEEILRQVKIMSLVGVGLFGIVLIAPDAAPHHGPFFMAAVQSSWRNLLDLPAAWASVKIMLFFAGLFLLIESAGTMLAVMKMKALALLVFCLQVVPCLGLLSGSYYLVKSLL